MLIILLSAVICNGMHVFSSSEVQTELVFELKTTVLVAAVVFTKA